GSASTSCGPPSPRRWAGRCCRRSTHRDGRGAGGGRKRHERCRYTSAVPFDPQYVANVLGENFKDAQALFIQPLISIQYAHLVMLAERRIISPDHAHVLREALDGITAERIGQASFDGTCEDLFFHVEHLIATACGDDVA